MPSGPTPFQARFVTATQQLLALAVVCAALTPAVGVISLDVVAQAPERLGGRCAGGPDVGVRRGGAEVLQAPQRPGVGRAA